MEFGKALFRAVRNIEDEIREGKDLEIGGTVGETFERNEIKKLKRNGYFYFIPENKRGKLICLSDSHGNRPAFEASLHEFFKNPDSYLVVTGDFVSAFGPDEYEMIKAMLKLKANPETSKRVAWLRGNCETAVWPMEVTEDNTLYERLGFKPDVVYRHKGLEVLFRKLLPVAAVSENKGLFVHGLPQNLNLKEVNQCANYEASPDQGVFGSEKDGSRYIFKMLEGDIRGRVSKTRAEIVSQTIEQVGQNLDKVGAEFLIRGHQKKLLTEIARSSFLLEEERGKKVMTIHSGRFKKQGGDTYLVLPNQEFHEITSEMVRKVE